MLWIVMDLNLKSETSFDLVLTNASSPISQDGVFEPGEDLVIDWI